MAVKIVLERTVKEGKKEELLALLRQLRAKAIHQPGYIAGETLCSIDRPTTHLVISTWHSLQEWRAWEYHPERRVLVAQIEALLTTPSKMGLFIESSASVSWPSIPEGI